MRLNLVVRNPIKKCKLKSEAMKTNLLIIISGATLLIAGSCASEAPRTEYTEKAICVKTEILAEVQAAVPVHSSGILSSKQISKLSFKTGGIISQLFVEEGSYVKKGQLLATLDMTEISAQVEQARLIFEKAERDLKRAKNLYADTVVTLEQYQDATSAYDIALQNKNIAEFNLRYSSILAPANGRVIAKLAEENEMIGPGMPMFVFTGEGKDEWIIKTGVSDRDAVQIEQGNIAEIVFDAFPEQVFNAKVKSISGISDPMSGTFEVELEIQQGKHKFINGLVAQVNIESKNNQTVTLVPSNALTEADGNKGFVYVVQPKDTTAKKVPVTIAYIANTGVAVLEALNKIGPVITSGSSFLEEGSKINVLR